MKTIVERIVGFWSLESSKLFDENKKNISDPLDGASGLINYSGSIMSVQIMPKGYEEKTESDYHAYYGLYSIDAKGQLITHHIDGSTHRKMIGHSFTRKITFLNENTMVLCTEPAEDVFDDGRLLYHEATWKRI